MISGVSDESNECWRLRMTGSASGKDPLTDPKGLGDYREAVYCSPPLGRYTDVELQRCKIHGEKPRRGDVYQTY